MKGRGDLFIDFFHYSSQCLYYLKEKKQLEGNEGIRLALLRRFATETKI